MRIAASVIAVMSVLVLSVTLGIYLPIGVVTLLSGGWWVVPFTISGASILALGATATIGAFRMGRTPVHLLTGAYLATGLSIGLLSLSATLPLGRAPPEWVAFSTPILLAMAAWIHYRTLDYPEEKMVMKQDSAPWSFIPGVTETPTGH